MSLVIPASVWAAGLQAAPREYRTTLTAGEKKKGVIDISNPGATPIIVHVKVLGFRQINDEGGLRFFDSPELQRGITTDLDDIELGPREAVRMYFIIDGALLPTGDVYAAILMNTQDAASRAGVGQQVRVGTLLSITNRTPSSRTAEIIKLNTSFIHLGTTIRYSYTMRNTGDPKKTTGYYPVVATHFWPFGASKTESSKLVFAGRSRTNESSLESPWLGFYVLKVQHEQSERSRLIFVIRKPAIVLSSAGALALVVIIRFYGRRSMIFR